MLPVAAAAAAAATFLLALSAPATAPRAQAVSATQPAAAARGSQAALGAELFAKHCSLCHGADGKRGAAFQTPLWGPGTQIAKFGTAQGLFEYNQMLMPFDDPTKLNDEQKWAVTAFLLASHGALPANQALGPANAKTVPIN